MLKNETSGKLRVGLTLRNERGEDLGADIDAPRECSKYAGRKKKGGVIREVRGNLTCLGGCYLLTREGNRRHAEQSRHFPFRKLYREHRDFRYTTTTL